MSCYMHFYGDCLYTFFKDQFSHNFSTIFCEGKREFVLKLNAQKIGINLAFHLGIQI